jgi:hypothetical protein
MNVRKHTIDIFQHLVVPVAQYKIALRFEKLCACCVGYRSRRMLSAIHLNDDARRVAREINDVTPKPNLPPKMCVCQRQAMTQVPPELPFRISRRSTH